jgi:hypothetical protein
MDVTSRLTRTVRFENILPSPDHVNEAHVDIQLA